jgi:hypothetical protein
MIALAAALCAVAAFGALSYRYLRSAAYSPVLAAFCAALTAGQMLVSITTAVLPALLLALTIYLIVSGAVAFARLQNVRSVVLLSGALAVVQGVNPLGTVMAATLVPVLVGLRDSKTFRARSASLLILLLFIPMSSAVFRAYLAQTSYFNPSAWLLADVARFAAYRPGWAFADFRLQAVARAVELAAIALPVWATAAIVRTRVSTAIAAVCIAGILAATIAAFLGHPRPVAVAAPALAMPIVLALCQWPPARRAAGWVVAAPAFGVLLTWFCAELAA